MNTATLHYPHRSLPTLAVGRSRSAWWLSLLVLGTAFFLSEHDLTTSRDEAFTLSLEEMESTAAGGNAKRRLAFLSIAMLGVCFAASTWHRPHRLRGALAVWLLLAAGWFAISALWSESPTLTLRRTFVLGCCFLCVYGLSRRFSLRDVMTIGLVLACVFLALGVLAEIALGTFRPWSGGYRFSGTLHPNTQGVYLAFLCLSSFALLQTQRRHRGVLIAAFCAGFLCLVLTKSRTSAGGVLLAMAAMWTIRTPLPKKILVVLSAGWLIAVAALGVLLVGADVGDDLTNAALLGRKEKAGSLTGRLPIWTELSRHIGERPFTGYGYATFWTAGRIEDVSTELQWPIMEAHSSYVETLLAVGLVGLMLVLATVCCGLTRSAACFRRTGDPAAMFFFGLLIYAVINAATESAMATPLLVPCLIVCGLLKLAADGSTPAPVTPEVAHVR